MLRNAQVQWLMTVQNVPDSAWSGIQLRKSQPAISYLQLNLVERLAIFAEQFIAKLR